MTDAERMEVLETSNRAMLAWAVNEFRRAEGLLKVIEARDEALDEVSRRAGGLHSEINRLSRELFDVRQELRRATGG